MITTALEATASSSGNKWVILTEAINVNIYELVALDSVDISTVNDVISYCRSAANRVNGRILRYYRVAISQ